MKQAWALAEREILQREFPHQPATAIASMLHRTLSSVNNQAHLMGLRKSPAYQRQQAELRNQRLIESGTAARFVKGLVPHNKGVAMPEAVYRKCQATMFKPGQLPATTHLKGSQRLSKDGYLEQHDGRHYRLQHYLIWEAVNGPVPDGHALCFVDGNKTNVTLANLALTPRSELMRRNTITRFPPELRAAIHALSTLKKRIHAKQNQ